MKQLLILPLLLLILGNNTYANTTSVDKLFAVMNMDEQLIGGFEAMLPVIDQMAAQFRLDSEGKKELLNIYRVWFNDDIDRNSIMEKMKALYSEAFNDKELDELTRFYQTETGQKFLNKSSELMQTGAQIGMIEAQSKQPELLNRLQPFLEKHNIK